MKKIAILGATVAQKPLYEKARKLGAYIVGISQAEGAICNELADKFYPISLAEMDKVVEICRDEKVDGVVSNCSEFSTKVVAYVAEKLKLDGTPYETILRIQDKDYTRNISNHVLGFSKVKSMVYDGNRPNFFPCIVKPIPSCAKKGLSIAYDGDMFDSAIKYANEFYPEKILIEEFIEGCEVSVETISCRGKHYVVQITDKETSGAPHFVELSHHQPSSLYNEIQTKIKDVVLLMLNEVGFVTGATHTELKINSNGEIYLIEINPRGGGDEISSKLVELSTGFDYIGSMILASLGCLEEPLVTNQSYSGIYFLTKQTESRLPFFLSAVSHPWYIEGKVDTLNLTECVGNNHKDGYLIYQSESKVYPHVFDVSLLNGTQKALDLLLKFHQETNQYTDQNENEAVCKKFLRLGYVIGVVYYGRLVAMMNLYCNREETQIAYINNVYVLPSYRKLGLAKSMMAYAISIVKNKQIYKEIHLHVAKDNESAIKMYLSLDFKFLQNNDTDLAEMVKTI